MRTIIRFKKASFWWRLVGFLIDGITISLIGHAVSSFFGFDNVSEHWLVFGLFYTYNILMDHFFQGTLAKKILLLKVITVDGKRPSLGNAFYRNLGKILSAVPLFYGYLRILAPYQKQTVHDALGKCLVVEVISEKVVKDARAGASGNG